MSDDLKAYAHELQKALTGLSGGGSEMFVKHGDDFRADIYACVAQVRQRFDNAHTRLVEAVYQRDAALKQRDELLEALKAIRETYAHSKGQRLPVIAQIDDIARSAIARATGASS